MTVELALGIAHAADRAADRLPDGTEPNAVARGGAIAAVRALRQRAVEMGDAEWVYLLSDAADTLERNTHPRAPRAGDRVVDGGEPGVLVLCRECSGSGLLHQLDHLPAPVEPLADAQPGGPV
ncbi:hypothetical protein [Amycolatopsis thermophila]|uniref:Uncharacterized protein n=1 Tax=Amycolatopsis thermophila TaxID=206084 RepID=A0ABU0EMK8_9PSEU|nr:hypothetical protein [Amycolatopsis thermophila]MDQ0376519.1 hypothetical protein [Amycolatopsis thermophila]